MRELPILFSGPMVRAIQKNKKTMTRRVIKPCSTAKLSDGNSPEWVYALAQPRYQVGDRLWVREKILRIPRVFDGDYHSEAIYAADNLVVPGVNWVWEKDTLPGMFMLKSCARLWLEVTAVKAERLQDISENDAVAEGIEQWQEIFYREYDRPDSNPGWTREPVYSFQTLWDSLNGKTHPWENNDWIWAYTFRRTA